MQILLDTAERCSAVSHCCHRLTISSPIGDLRCDPFDRFASFAHGEQQTNEPESQAPAQISAVPHCVHFYMFLKRQLQTGVDTKLLLCLCVRERIDSSPPSQLKCCPQPSGKWYNEDLYAYSLSHFNCKRCTHPALWTSDGCIRGRAQNMTVHHVHTMGLLTFYTDVDALHARFTLLTLYFDLFLKTFTYWVNLLSKHSLVQFVFNVFNHCEG